MSQTSEPDHVPIMASHSQSQEFIDDLFSEVTSGVIPSQDVEEEKSENEIVLDGCGGSWFCHPNKMGYKVLGLIFMCMLGFGSYFCFDNPGALQVHLIYCNVLLFGIN